MKTAVIFGVTGQDGSYLSEFLLEKSYRVVGVTRRCSVDTFARIKHLISNPHFSTIEGDITDYQSVLQIITLYKADEVYVLAAQSHVGTSFTQPQLTWNVNAMGVCNVLEAIRQTSTTTKMYQASTSEMFGSNITTKVDGRELVSFQNEKTEFSPNSPYAIAKLAAHHSVRMYREAYGVFGCCGILFNHESPRRGEKFVTRKITKYVAELKHHNLLGFPKLRLGNLEACRDWGHAKDYVRGMWMMLQQDVADDYVLATGTSHSIKHLLDVAFKHIGVDDWMPYVEISSGLYRPNEVEYLNGDASKARRILGWKPEYNFEQLIHEMIDEDYRTLQCD